MIGESIISWENPSENCSTKEKSTYFLIKISFPHRLWECPWTSSRKILKLSRLSQWSHEIYLHYARKWTSLYPQSWKIRHEQPIISQKHHAWNIPLHLSHLRGVGTWPSSTNLNKRLQFPKSSHLQPPHPKIDRSLQLKSWEIDVVVSGERINKKTVIVLDVDRHYATYKIATTTKIKWSWIFTAIKLFCKSYTPRLQTHLLLFFLLFYLLIALNYRSHLFHLLPARLHKLLLLSTLPHNYVHYLVK